MEEDIQLCLEDSKESMEKVIQHMVHELAKIRAGKASPDMLNGVEVDYYGTNTPLNQVGNINTPDAKNIIIQPWEKDLLKPIEQAILEANLGFNPQNNGESIRITIPPLTEERRREYAKTAKAVAENSKVSIRNVRKDANDFIKNLKNDGMSEDLVKNTEDKVQDITNAYISKIDAQLSSKEEDIMTI
ncbi:MAG: ribosome recycling factor [Bacteroidetes bacterium]|nr:ribosome recycling factor [Bacteroidia bacterium]PCH68672.1 MAG: ribosome recycling factor [Bacteroidota bacterium]